MIDPQVLIEKAREYVGEFPLATENASAGYVSAAILSGSGQIYTGICIDVSSGIGFCAEHSAIAEMLKHRETVIKMVVAVNQEGISPPCGRCREFMLLLDKENTNAQVIVGEGLIKPLKELLPYHWLDGASANKDGM
ncbi:MAG: cytidine deaminase [Anaerolineae bacterium]|nr:cytidine deaminase [Anaerolineae bacterium]